MKEIPLKQWLAEEAGRTGSHSSTIWRWKKAGKYRHIKFRRVNKRVVFVTLNPS